MSIDPRLGEIAYLAWALPRYGQVRFDLASSGAPPAPADLLDLDPRDLAEPRAPFRFRDALAPWIGVPPDEIMPCLGTSQGLWLACAALVSPGDVVLVEHPTYEPLRRLPAGWGARVVPFDRLAGVDVDDVGDAVRRHRASVVVVSSPHNPTGATLPDATIRDLGDTCAALGATLVVDEVYRPFQVAPGSPWGSARGASPNVWATGSLTKRFGLGYARAGSLAAPASAMRGAWAGMQHGCGQPGTLFAAVGLAALERLPALADAVLPDHRIASGRAIVDGFVGGHSGLSWSAPAQGPYGFVIQEGTTDLRPAIEDLAERHGVLVAPGSFFGMPNGFRVGWTAPEDTLRAGLDALSGLV